MGIPAIVVGWSNASTTTRQKGTNALPKEASGRLEKGQLDRAGIPILATGPLAALVTAFSRHSILPHRGNDIHYRGDTVYVDEGPLNGGFSFRSQPLSDPPYVNLDMRLSKTISIAESARAEVLIEFFNLLNRANAAAVQQFQNLSRRKFRALTESQPSNIARLEQARFKRDHSPQE